MNGKYCSHRVSEKISRRVWQEGQHCKKVRAVKQRVTLSIEVGLFDTQTGKGCCLFSVHVASGTKEYGVATAISPYRAELTALVDGLNNLTHPSNVCVVSQSKYVTNCIRYLGWWKRNGWKTKVGGNLQHLDLIKELDKLLSKHRVVLSEEDNFGDNL